MKRLLLSIALLFGSMAAADAACVSPAVMHDFAGTAFNMSLATNGGDGNCSSNMTVVGTVPLPTGAATSALQTTINTTLGTPFQAGGSIGNTSFQATQATSSNFKAQVDPLTAASWGIGTATQNSASATNGQLALGQFNTAPTTITSGNMSPLQLDSSGKLIVNCGTGCSASSSITGWAGGTLGAMANYGTSPGAVLVPGVNAFVTNTNANGSAVSASSSPVVIASDQAAVAVKAASGAYASGSIASGAVASGAYASGSIASGAVAAGAYSASSLAVNAFVGESTTGNIGANNTTAVVVKASAGTLYGVQLANIGSVPLYLKFYNATSATCGTGTPVKRLVIPVNSTAANAAGSNISFGPQGVAFSTGITYCLTGGITDADTTAPAANVGLVNIDWN